MSTKNYETCKETGKCDLYIGVGGKQVIETAPKETQMLDLANKDFKAAIINMFRELKETMFHQVQNINKGTEFIFWKNQMEILEVKRAIN